MSAEPPASRWLKRAVLGAALGMAGLQIATLRWDFPLTQFWPNNWCMHHDEKLVVPDARYFALGKTSPVRITDFRYYPVSAAFGVAGPGMASLGMRLLGLNSCGLRIVFVLLACATTILVGLLLLEAAPGPVGAAVALCYALSYSNFMLNRHAIIENVLTMFVVGLLWLHARKRDALLRNLGPVCFLAGSTAWFKVNFPAYVILLLFCIVLVEDRRPRTLLKAAVWCIAGLAFFEALHAVVLWRLGLLGIRYGNLLTALSLHLHRPTSVDGIQLPTLAGAAHPFFRFGMMFVDWFSFPFSLAYGADPSGLSAGLILLQALAWAAFLSARKDGSRPILAAALFCLAYLWICSLFYVYMKRAVPVLPLLAMIAAYLCRIVLSPVLSGSRGAWLRGAAVAAIVSCCVGYAARQALIYRRAFQLRSDEVRANSARLDQDLPAGSALYSHCYGERFFWQAAGIRFFSGDDQSLSNSGIMDWAVRERGRYVLLARPNASLLAPRPGVRRIKLLTKYQTSAFVSDNPLEFWLLELEYDEA